MPNRAGGGVRPSGSAPGHSRPEAEAEPLPQLRELSPQERRIVALISQEYQTKEVARELGISGETVKTHLRRVYAKLGVRSRAGLVARAYARFDE